MNERFRWFLVVLFATSMAWAEAAAVFYLRVFINRVQPYQLDPLPSSVGLGQAELLREAATILMLGCIGWLAGVNRRDRFGYGLLAFGVWDMLYYVFLVLLSGWPNSLLDWDILFLIPVPWWAPVLAPVCIATWMVIVGTAITQFHFWPRPPAWIASLCGLVLALYTFITDALRVLGEGPRAVREVLPSPFNWLLFLAAILLLIIPLLDMLWRLRVMTSARAQLERSVDKLISNYYR
jgi:hypothetical protein